MGSCSSKSTNEEKEKNRKDSVKIQTFDNILSAPPNLLQKPNLPSNFNLIMNTETLSGKLCDIVLNKNLEKGGKIDSALGELIQANSLNETAFLATAPELFEKLHELTKTVKDYDNSKLIKKILEDFHLIVYEEFSSVIKESSRTNFFKDNNFCVNIICHLTEIYQILLTYKLHKIEKKKSKSKIMKYWWLLGNTSSKTKDLDTFAYVRKKFIIIGKEIGNQYKTLLGNQGESQPLTIIRASSSNKNKI